MASSLFGGGGKQIVVINDPRRTTSTDWSNEDDFAASDTVRIYVSQSAGNDSNNGLTSGTAKKTLAAGMALIMSGQVSVPNRPDQLLLKRGDTWTDEIIGNWTVDGTSGGACISGRSTAQRVVIGTYGTGARPKIKSGALQGPTLVTGPLTTANVAILGLDFDSYLYPAGNGSDTAIDWVGGASYVLIEDCLFPDEFQTPIRFGTPLGFIAQTDFVIRRNVFDTILGQPGAWIQLGRTERLLIQENHFDGRHGLSWTGFENSIGAGIMGDSGCLSRDILIDGNTFSNFGTHAIYLPGGATVRNNLIFLGGNGIQVGNYWQGSPPGFTARPGGVPVEIVGNYISDLKDLTSDLANTYRGGRGIYVANCMGGGLVHDNILTRNTGTKPWALEVYGSGNTAGGIPCPVLDLSIRRNKVYKWWRTPSPYHYKGIFISGTNAPGQPADITDLVFKDNDIQEPAGNMSLLAQIDSTLAASGEISSGRNRFFRVGLPDDRYSPLGFSSTDIAGYRAAMGDTSSVETQVAYANADKTIGDYHGSIGGTATEAAYVTAIRAQSRYDAAGNSGWNDQLMAKNVLAYMRDNFAG